MKSILIIIIVTLSGGASGGVDTEIEQVEFSDMEMCLDAQTALTVQEVQMPHPGKFSFQAMCVLK